MAVDVVVAELPGAHHCVHGQSQIPRVFILSFPAPFPAPFPSLPFIFSSFSTLFYRWIQHQSLARDQYFYFILSQSKMREYHGFSCTSHRFTSIYELIC
jgi:hypothetical protein